jgi:ribosomal protein S20
MKAADKAAQRNVIHSRKAARIKSRLLQRLQAVS